MLELFHFYAVVYTSASAMIISAASSITKHPNYKYLSDYDKKNTFDMEKHLRRRPALVKPDEPFDYYEISEADLQEDTAHE